MEATEPTTGGRIVLHRARDTDPATQRGKKQSVVEDANLGTELAFTVCIDPDVQIRTGLGNVRVGDIAEALVSQGWITPVDGWAAPIESEEP